MTTDQDLRELSIIRLGPNLIKPLGAYPSQVNWIRYLSKNQKVFQEHKLFLRSGVPVVLQSTLWVSYFDGTQSQFLLRLFQSQHSSSLFSSRNRQSFFYTRYLPWLWSTFLSNRSNQMFFFLNFSLSSGSSYHDCNITGVRGFLTTKLRVCNFNSLLTDIQSQFLWPSITIFRSFLSAKLNVQSTANYWVFK